jgi:hypothetical protein
LRNLKDQSHEVTRRKPRWLETFVMLRVLGGS